LLQLASLTAKGEKKNGSRFVIPPSFFKTDNLASEKEVIVKETPSLKETESPYESISEENAVQTKNIEITDPEEVPTTERVIDRPQILAERNAQRVSALSLKSIQKKQELKKELVANQPDEETLPIETFDEPQMIIAWKEYADQVEQDGKYNLLSHLTMGVPKLEGSLIHLEFPNATIKVEVERAKYELLGFLREKLQNYDIDLSIEVNETIEKRYAYTPREKFEKLKEKNPMIETLRKEFDLEI
jgi:DNA polymerase-3 subunit gamma/tau